MTALLLCLGLMSTLTVSAVSSDTSGLTPQMAKAYLSVLDQQIQKYGGYAQKGTYEWTNGVVGGMIQDFDQNGVPELFLWSIEREDDFPYTCEGLWTWDGNRARQLYDGKVEPAGHYGGTETIYLANGKLYVHSDYIISTHYGCGSDGWVYGFKNGKWDKILSYYQFDCDEANPYGYTDTYEITENGKRSEMSKTAFDLKLGKYRSNDSLEVISHSGGNLSFKVPVTAKNLRAELAELAVNQPSSWAKAEVEAAKAAGLVPALTGDPGYRNSITRQQFAELVVALVEQATGKTLPAAPAETFSDCTNLAVRKASAAGIVNGMGDDLFAPNQTTNREQIATMVHRAIQYIKTETGTDLTPAKGSISKFADKSSVSSWAVEGVGALAANGIMNGTSSTQLSPKASCTVEQSILLSFRTFEKLP